MRSEAEIIEKIAILKYDTFTHDGICEICTENQRLITILEWVLGGEK
jgi:hypothetical protein